MKTQKKTALYVAARILCAFFMGIPPLALPRSGI